ncbi:glycoside hydrolase family 3 N-terminal domain-containing protein [Oryzobacter telluris]|uniref:glycoside hydrolase family 3 N-terminal domain-containing protein n=1 Tax=Oryzobacter telluris TaxID=3149179 RepID=UPI00370D5753
MTSPRTHALRAPTALVVGGVLAAVAGCSTGTPTASPSGSATSSSPAPSSASPSPSASPTCAEQTFEALSADQRLGQLLMVGFDTNAARGSLDDLVTSDHVGNVIYLGGWDGAAKVMRTSKHLGGLVSTKATGDVGLMIAADQEGGIVHQLRGDGFTRPPKALDQAKLEPAELTKDAAGWARQMKDVGVNVNLAPVADTVPEDIGRANGPIGRFGRQYGSDPNTVATYSVAFLEGMLEEGVEGAVKHFPGLGRVRNNTDFSSSGITDSVATADDPFLEPFRANIEAGVGLVMMSSARYPKLDAKNPAMFSEKIVTGLLREKLGYEGVVITDDVNAEALKNVSPGDRAVRLVDAGGDVVLTGRAADADDMLEALADKASAEPEFAAKVEASVRRVLALKDRMGLLPCSKDAG